MDIFMVKRADGSFMPSYDSDHEKAKKIKVGREVDVKIKQGRNLCFHRLYFALLNMAYSNWEPPLEETKWGTPKKSFDRFRKDMIIKAGFYDLVVDINGNAKVEAQSISFGSMSQETFEELYNNTIDTIINLVGLNRETIEQAIQDFT